MTAITYLMGNCKKTWEVNEKASLRMMKKACPSFFSQAALFGNDETRVVYRGQLIIQTSTTFGGFTSRRTIVYLFVNNKDLFCMGSGMLCTPEVEIQLAKEAIDVTLDTGTYTKFE